MNQAVFLALLQPGDTFMGLDLAAGGHLTHGSPVNMSGKWFKAEHYTVRREDQIIDMDAVAKPRRGSEAEIDHRRRLRLFARRGISSDSARSPTASALTCMVDMAHFAGLVAGGVHAVAGAACACRDHDHAQVAARPARRH